MSRLGLEVVEGDGADNWWVDRFFWRNAATMPSCQDHLHDDSII